MEQEATKVLLVEDNPGDARLLREMLAEISSPRFSVTSADTLDEASQRLDRERFDVVLLDLKLPDGSRTDTIAAIHGQALKAPVVVLTGLDDEVVALWAAQQGAQDYLVKGRVDRDSLVTSIHYAIDRHKRQAELLAGSQPH